MLIPKPFPEKLKFLFWLFVCLLIIFADRLLTLTGPALVDTPDKALFEYRADFNRTGRHDLNRLKDVLYQQLGHTDIRVRMNVAEVLGELKGPGIMNDLWKIYTTESEAAVRNSAIAGLLNHGSPAVLDFLWEAMSDPDPDVRREAIEGCSVFADASHRDILEKKFTVEPAPLNRLALAAVLYKIGDTGKTTYLKNGLLENRDPQIRNYVAHLLQDSGIKIDPVIINEGLAHENTPVVKVWLTALLAAQGDAPARESLKNLLASDEEPALRSPAAQALNALGERAFVYPYLLELLKADQEEVRERAIEDLVDFKDYPLLPVLSRVLNSDPSITVREIAAWTMGERGDPAALPFLEHALYDKSAFVRTGVLAALYKIKFLESMEKSDKAPSR